MAKVNDILFEYIKNVIYQPNKAMLDLEALGKEYEKLGKGLMFMAQCFSECHDFAKELSKGNLKAVLPPRENVLAGPLKSLHSSLRHLTWQSQQVADGDYSQRVDFLGEFADAFNTMIKQLAERQQKLEQEIEKRQKNLEELSLNNKILGDIMQGVPQFIFAVDPDTMGLLFVNDSAKAVIEINPFFLDTLTLHLPDVLKLSTPPPIQRSALCMTAP